MAHNIIPIVSKWWNTPPWVPQFQGAPWDTGGQTIPMGLPSCLSTKQEQGCHLDPMFRLYLEGTNLVQASLATDSQIAINAFLWGLGNLHPSIFRCFPHPRRWWGHHFNSMGKQQAQCECKTMEAEGHDGWIVCWFSNFCKWTLTASLCIDVDGCT